MQRVHLRRPVTAPPCVQTRSVCSPGRPPSVTPRDNLHCRAAILLVLLTLFGPGLAWAQRTGQIELRVSDDRSNEPIAVNLYLTDAAGRPRSAPKLPFWKDHFAFEGSVVLRLPAGQYNFVMERGPEYQVRTGNFEISRQANALEHVTMHRFVDMKEEGWWSGDLHIHRTMEDLPLLMRAQDLHVAPVITWWNDQNAWKNAPLPAEPLVVSGEHYLHHLLAGEDERGGGALLYFNMPEPLDLPAHEAREYPPMTRFLEMAHEREPGLHVDIEKPFWWDVPLWLAMGMVDSIGLANNHMLREGMLDNEAWGKPRDTTRYPSPRGNGYWSQDIYYHVLNSGLRIPPSAGSASGVLDNPVGYNRVYVHCPQEFSWESWWEGLRAGRVIVTNGPLLRPSINGQVPGYVFRAAAGETVSLTVDLKLSLRDRVDYLEVVKNGEVVEEVRLDEYRNRQGALPAVEFTQSGWLLVRAVTAEPRTFRFASTGPYYVEIGGQPRVSRKSAQFFLDWTNERMSQLVAALPDADQQAEVLRYHERARDYWMERLQQANAD